MPTQRSNEPERKRDVFAERYARSRNRLSPAFKRVADFIDTNRIDAMMLSALDLARMTGTSDATVVRAVQALGFDGLHDMRTELAASIGGRNAPADNLTRTFADIGESAEAAMDDVLDSLATALASMRTDPIRRTMLDILKALHRTHRIVVFGVGPTAHIAAYFAARLRRKGRRQAVLNQTGTGLADQLLELERGDAVLMLAYGKAYPEAEATVSEACRLQIPVILVTDSADESLARQATIVLTVPRGRSERVALHGTTLACLEMLLLGIATTDRDTAIAALGDLDRLREATRPARRRARIDLGSDEE